MSRAHAIGEALGDHRLDTSWSTGYFHASTGDVERGIADCRGGLERARDPLNTAAALGFLGYAYLEKGDVPAAREALERSVQMLRQTGFQPLLGWFLAFLAEAELKEGTALSARELALQALAITREAKFLYGVGLAQRAVGRVDRGSGDLAAAEAALREALETFTTLEVPFEIARTHLDLGELAHARGATAEVARELTLAHGGFAELGFPRYQERVARLSNELALPVPQTAALSEG
jgi:tetratricopeptide (TPR) repeat protein